MPVIKSAKKKLRQDKKRQYANREKKISMKAALKAAKENPTAETVVAAVKAADKAAKHHIIHKNKASRLKSMLAKLLSGEKTAHTHTTKRKSKAAKLKRTKKTNGKAKKK